MNKVIHALNRLRHHDHIQWEEQNVRLAGLKIILRTNRVLPLSDSCNTYFVFQCIKRPSPMNSIKEVRMNCVLNRYPHIEVKQT